MPRSALSTTAARLRAELPALIPDRTETIMIQARPLDLWDNWRVIALLAVILLAEWTIRPRMRLL